MTRHVVQHVQRDRADAGVPGLPHRGRNVARVVPPTQLPELLRVKGLRTQREPRDPRCGEVVEVAPIVGTGVRLDRDLGAGRDAQAVIDELEQATDRGSGKERRRASAQVHGLERCSPIRVAPVQGIRAQADLRTERVDEGIDPGAGAPRHRPRVDDEVAVGAEGEAERNVDVEGHRGP